MSADATDWSSIIYKGAESDELDYKAAQNWNELSRGGRAKFVRHCLALANTKGGYIVVGVGEDSNGRPVEFTGLTEEESKSFDPTTVGNFITRFSDPPIDFTLERPVVDGKCYAVFAVKPFRELPHVCPSNCETELLRGVFYIRTKDASSRPAYRATELHSIIQRALRNQREMLGRMLRGILYENNLTGNETASDSSFFSEDLLHSRMFFEKRVPKNKSAYLFEFFIVPPKYNADLLQLSTVKKAVEDTASLYPGASSLADFDFPDTYFTNTSLRGFNTAGNVMIQLWKTGLLHFAGEFPVENQGDVSFAVLVSFLAKSVSFAAQYYSFLGFSEELLSLNFKIRNAEDLQLIPGNGLQGRCRIPEIEIHFERSASDLVSGCEYHTVRFLRSVFERFNIENLNDEYFLSLVKESLQR